MQYLKHEGKKHQTSKKLVVAHYFIALLKYVDKQITDCDLSFQIRNNMCI